MGNHLPILQERQCDTCRACCTPLGIPELDKPPGVTCKYLVADGCSIYDKRPQDCRDYYCGWRLGVGHVDHRPDRVGILLTAHQNIPGIIPDLLDVTFMAHEVWPDARKESNAQELLGTIGSRGFLVFVHYGEQQCQVVGPGSVVAAVLRWCHHNNRIAPFGILVGYEPK